MMEADQVAHVYALLESRGVRLWVDGGWGVDALLGRQTRPHKDMDALVVFDDLPQLAEALAADGFGLKEIWEENRWQPRAAPLPLVWRPDEGGQVATAFVLADDAGRELDFHALTVDGAGRGVLRWGTPTDFFYPAEALQGRGQVAGRPVRCLSAAMHMRTHTGYELKEKDLEDLHNLHEAFGVDYPDELAHLRRRET